MKEFKEKVKEAREILGMSQSLLAEKVGVSQRSIASYEGGEAKPRGSTARKLAKELNVSVEYLLNEEIMDSQIGIEFDPYLESVRNSYGTLGEKEAKELLEKNMALFAGGELSQEGKDAFFEAIMKAYVICKEEAKKTYGKRK